MLRLWLEAVLVLQHRERDKLISVLGKGVDGHGTISAILRVQIPGARRFGR